LKYTVLQPTVAMRLPSAIYSGILKQNSAL
jgi:hypothetical protein